MKLKYLLLGAAFFLGYSWYKKQKLNSIISNYISFDQSGQNIQVLRSILNKSYALNLPINTEALTPNEVTLVVNFLEQKLGSMNPITQNAIMNKSLKILDLLQASSI